VNQNTILIKVYFISIHIDMYLKIDNRFTKGKKKVMHANKSLHLYLSCTRLQEMLLKLSKEEG
jgi:hypothetical protein